jgi:hypothetical protein
LPRVTKIASQLDERRRVIVPVGRPSQDVAVLPWEDVPSNGETYLRLLEVDLGDPDAILGFVDRYGTLGGVWAFAELRGLPYFRGRLRPGNEWDIAVNAVVDSLGPRHDGDPLLGAVRSGARTRSGARDLRFVETFRELRRSGKPLLDNRWFRLQYLETLNEFRFAAGVIRDLACAWRVLRGEVEPGEVDWFSSRGGYPIETIPDVSRLLTWVFPRVVQRFAPHFEITLPPGVARTRGTRRESKVEPAKRPGDALLYQLCALELYNHIVEQAEYHVCKKCGHVFVHQEGGPTTRKSRSTGVLYCTLKCAKAQAQRDYYRRRQQG